jgi:integrase
LQLLSARFIRFLRPVPFGWVPLQSAILRPQDVPRPEVRPPDFSAKGTALRRILTDALCRTKPPRAGRLEIADLRQAGLVLRITPNGARSFAYRFRHPHSRKTLRATIGPYPATTLEAARKRAKQMAAQIADGTNPIEAKNAEREAASTRTFQALADRYLKEHAERHKRPRSAEEDRRNLAVHVLPKWAKRDFRAIRRADVIEVIESIVSAGKHAAGNRVHSLISKVFSFAIDADLLEANPAARLRKRGVEKVGRRVLDDTEIRTFWRGIVLPPVSRQVGLALRLALLTATRASEIAGARTAEFQNLDKPEQAAWLIPGDRAKNRRDHLVLLAPLAVQTVKSAIELSGDSDFLFPTRLGRGGPIDRHTLTVAMVRFAKSLKGSAAKTWHQEIPTPHDLRRTCNSRLAKLAVPKEIRDRTLNHITSLRDPESKHYNIYEFETEKRQALGKWAAEIEALIKPAAIVPIAKGRRR